MTKTRDDIAMFARAAPAAPAAWRIETAPVAYEKALAVMEARAAAIAAGEADELVWLIEHPALYTAGTSARPEHLVEPRFPVFAAGRGGQFTYHGPGERREDRIGVWVRRRDKGEGCEDKIAAIGIRVKRWVSLHGVSLNVDPDLGHFGGIVPCGVGEPRFGVTSFLDLGHMVSVAEVDMALRCAFVEVFGPVRAEGP